MITRGQILSVVTPNKKKVNKKVREFLKNIIIQYCKVKYKNKKGTYACAHTCKYECTYLFLVPLFSLTILLTLSDHLDDTTVRAAVRYNPIDSHSFFHV